MKWTSLGALALAAATTLTWPAESQAQGWRGGGRWDGGGNWGGRYYDGGWGWGGRYYDGGWGWGGRTGFYLGNGYPYGGTYWGYGRGYYPFAYSYYSPGYNTGYTYEYSSGPATYSFSQPGYSYQSAYPSDASVGRISADAVGPVQANVRLPDANAKLWIEGQEMTSQGLERAFISPPIDPGSRYVYTMRAQWSENGKTKDETRQVRVAPNDRVTVDFTAPALPGGAAGTPRQSGYGPEEGAEKPRNGETVTPPNDAEKATPRRDRDDKATPQSDEDKAKPRPDQTEKPMPQTKPATPPAPPERPRDNPPDRDQNPRPE